MRGHYADENLLLAATTRLSNFILDDDVDILDIDPEELVRASQGHISFEVEVENDEED